MDLLNLHYKGQAVGRLQRVYSKPVLSISLLNYLRLCQSERLFLKALRSSLSFTLARDKFSLTFSI